MKRIFAILLLFFVCFLFAGCIMSSSENNNESNNVSAENEMVAGQDDLKVDISKIEQIYSDEYNSQNGDSNCVRKIIEKLGDNGYIAIDSDNKVDMTNPDSVKEFIKSNESGEHDNICVLQIHYHAGINVLELITDEGKVSVIQTYYSFQDGEFTETVSVEFEADYFEYTNEGYLMIDGRSHSAESYVLTLSEEEKHIALRVEPLDEEYRELCAKYIEPVSYSLNNMFITSWNKDDYSNLDFYDIFDRFYKETYGTDCPYIMNVDLSIGNEYDIPADEFENVIMRHFEVSSEELHQRCRYDATKNVYVYRPRGFEEFDYAEVPYPEVVDFETNDDGSVTLIVNAVYPNENSSKLFSHRVTVSDKDGHIYYLSNEIIDDEESALWWHADRMSEDDWDKYYEDSNCDEDNQEAFEKGYNLPILQSDINQAEKETDELLDCIEDMYRPYQDDEAMIPEDVQEKMADVLADKGYIIRTDRVYSNIRNEELFERFLTDARNGKQGSVILYELEAAAAVDRYEYEFDGVNMYLYSSRMEIKLDGSRSQTYCSCTRIKSWRYTEAGWFCYKLCVPEYPEVTEIVDGSVLIRVKPMSEENRQASEKYVLGIGYQGNNILCSNWDADSLDTLDYTGMYEYLYAMDTGERFCLDEETEGIPADEFETLIMKYIPTSREIIRKSSAYDIENGVYHWVRLSCLNYTPTYFGTSYPEVIDIKENTDGTITLTVNAVCEMVLNDEAIITHELIIKENSDGSFMYMGNKILDDGINNIPDYEYRIRSSYGDDSDDM